MSQTDRADSDGPPDVMSEDPDSRTPPASPLSPRHPSEPGPLVRLRERLAAAFGVNGRSSLRADLEAKLKNGEAEDAFTASERFMLLNILKYSDKRVDDVMVPRVDIVAIDESARLSELLSTFQAAGHSRLPVFHDTLDDPRGMIHIKDFLAWIVKSAGAAAEADAQASGGSAEGKPGMLGLGSVDLSRTVASAQLTREVLYVPPSKPTIDLLLRMQASRVHMAIVIDEYGGTDGLVSIEDLVEEIVGNIEDEHDVPEGPLIRKEGARALIADGRADIDELEAILGVDLVPDEREEDMDTLGGLVFSLVGRVPARGEVVKHASGLEFEVLEGDPRRIKRLRIRSLEPIQWSGTDGAPRSPGADGAGAGGESAPA
jgi:CBS domain containing-hemolysin-like protein